MKNLIAGEDLILYDMVVEMDGKAYVAKWTDLANINDIYEVSFNAKCGDNVKAIERGDILETRKIK